MKLSLTDIVENHEPEAETENVSLAEMQEDTTDTVEEAPVETPEEEIPEKFKGKSITDVVRMYQEAEKQLGRQGQEIGEARKSLEQYQTVMDQYIASQTQGNQQPQQTEESEVDEVDFFSDPDSAVEAKVRKMLENSPDIQSARQLKAEITQQAALAELSKTHPDWQTITKDSGFAEWVQGSRFRMELASKADKYDYEAANDLFTMYKERAGYQKAAQAESVVERKQDVQKASTGSTQGSGESRGKRTYKRSDIRELMIKDPTRYRQLEPDIRQAYADGRVVGT